MRMTGQRSRTTPVARRPYRSCSRPNKPGLCSALGVRLRNNQTESTGTKVLDRRYDANIENATASASGGERAGAPTTPKNDGNKGREHPTNTLGRRTTAP